MAIWVIVIIIVVIFIVIAAGVGIALYLRSGTEDSSCIIAGCPEGKTCSTSTGQCIDAGKCNTNTDCLSGVCTQGECVTPPPPPPTGCVADGDCAAGFYCSQSVCRRSCGSDSECPGSSSICREGNCVLKACSSAIDCGENESCLNISGGGSQRVCVGGQSCSGTRCPEGLSCIAGICRQCSDLNPSLCGPTSVCHRGSCLDCGSTGPGSPNLECSTSRTCSRTGACCPSSDYGKGCRTSADCSAENPHCISFQNSGYCSCQLTPEGGTCGKDSDCQGGSCKQGYCAISECFRDSTCGEGRFCSNGACSSSILGSRCNLGREGTLVTPCEKAGFYCVNEVCSKEPGGYGIACDSNRNCQAGLVCRNIPSINATRKYCAPPAT